MINVSKPKIARRGAEHYVGIRKRVPMDQISATLPPLFGPVFAWMASRGINATGAPFFRYNIVEMDKDLEIDVAVPIAAPIKAGDGMISDSLPAGNYATILHIGPPSELQQATAMLLDWAQREGIKWQMDGDRWSARVERYLSDPQVETDVKQWKNELAFMIAKP